MGLALESNQILETADIETSSDEYAKRFSGDIGNYFLEIQEKITMDFLNFLTPNTTILDIGGGHAQLAVPVVNKNFDLTVLGSDQSCRKRLDFLLKPKSFKFIVGNLIDLDFPDNSFDVVIAFRLLSHVNQWEKLISEMCRVAKRAIILDYPDIRSFNIFYKILFNVKKNFEGNTRPFRTFSRSEIISEIDKNGFLYPTFKPEFFLPMVIHRVIKFVPILRRIEHICAYIGLRKVFGTPIIFRSLAQKNDIV